MLSFSHYVPDARPLKSVEILHNCSLSGKTYSKSLLLSLYLTSYMRISCEGDLTTFFKAATLSVAYRLCYSVKEVSFQGNKAVTVFLRSQVFPDNFRTGS